jgi:hypothetical protein
MTAPDMFALGGQQDDAELMEAERRLAEFRAHPPWRGEDVWPLYDMISNTEPRTLAGAAVKLRLMADQDIGILGGNCGAADEVSLLQVGRFRRGAGAEGGAGIASPGFGLHRPPRFTGPARREPGGAFWLGARRRPKKWLTL